MMSARVGEGSSMSAEQCTYEYWLGPREAKYSDSGVERSVKAKRHDPPRQRGARYHRRDQGCDVTDLDRVGIPNFMTGGPHDLGPGISYYNGKGTTRAAAHAGALMEAVERHAGERYDGPVIVASHHNLRSEHACVDPLEIQRPMICRYSEHLMLEWVLGFDLMTRRPTYAPLNCVWRPYSSDSGMALFYTSTNGLASGNTRVDAVCHALCEVIERDATGLAMARADVRPAVAALLGRKWDSVAVCRRSREGAADLAPRIARSAAVGSQAAARRARGGTAQSDVRDRHRRPSPAPSPNGKACPASRVPAAGAELTRMRASRSPAR